MRRTASLPAAVVETASRLESEGFEAWVAGESLARTLAGETPRAFELATSASPERCLEVFPYAVPTQLDRGIITVPSGQAPVDVVSLEGSLTAELTLRDFTVLAMAFSPSRQELCDPHGGHRDLEDRVLRCVGNAQQKLAHDPARVLRAARLVAEWGLVPVPEVEAAMREAAPSLGGLSPARARPELVRILLGQHAEAALALLRRTGAERVLIDHVRSDAATLVGSLPRVLEIRLAGWLRGTRARQLLRTMRFGIPRSQHVERLLANHPLDEQVDPRRDRALLRLLRELDPTEIEVLFAIREWEITHPSGSAAEELDATAVRKQLEAVRHAIERVRNNQSRSRRRTELAVDGGMVMQLLSCGPGRRVGSVLRFASEWVAEDPSRNDVESLSAAIVEWDRENGPAER
jgi:tRNA nucleotidyltransferase/poly(A) polymerase